VIDSTSSASREGAAGDRDYSKVSVARGGDTADGVVRGIVVGAVSGGGAALKLTIRPCLAYPATATLAAFLVGRVALFVR